MNSIQRQILSAFFFYACISVTASIGLVALLNGVVASLAGNILAAMVNYFLASLSFSTAHWVYFRGRRILLYY